MGINHFLVFVIFQHRGLHHLDMYCTLIIEDLNQTFILIADIWNYEMHE